MKISTKLIIIQLLASLAPFITISYLSIVLSRNALEKHITASFAELAEDKANSLALIIDERIHETRQLAHRPDIVDAVKLANARYNDNTEQEALQGILEKDLRWIAQKGETQTAKEILESPLSGLLKSYQELDHNRYGELFITDSRGAALAMTKILSDYYQADEQWWIESFADGRGNVFIDDRGMDKSVNALAIGGVVPIMDGDTVVGVLKINFKVSAILEIITDEAIRKRGASAALVRSQGTVLASTETSSQSPLLSSVEKRILKGESAGVLEDEHKHETIMAYAPVKASINTRIQAPGAIKGISGEMWEPTVWHVFLEIEKEVAFAEIIHERNLFILISLAVAMLVVFLAVSLGKTITRPVEALVEGTERVGRGDLDYKVGLKRSDELGTLSRAFDDMTESLKTTTASRDELEQEVTERIAIQRSLALAKEEAEAATEQKDKFVSLISHDLKNPLTTIVGFLKLTLGNDKTEFEPETRQRLEYAMKAGERMFRLVEEVLNMSRLRSGKIVAMPAFYDLQSIVSGILTHLHPVYSAKNIVIINGIPTNKRVYVDYILFSQVLENLLTNAVKFSFPGGTVTISMPKGDTSSVIVTDEGVGLSQERIETLFDFSKRQSTPGTVGEEGTGFGLPLSREIMENLGGTLTIESNEGAGSCFTARLPHLRPVALVAVDNEDAIIIRRVLETAGIDLVHAVEARTALKLVVERKPHLVIVDNHLPEIDVSAFLKEIKGNYQPTSIPIILIINNDEIKSSDQTFDLVANDCMTKPLDEGELFTWVSHHLP